MTADPGPVATEVQQVAVEHARRGVALQVGLRWVLVAFVALTVPRARRPVRHGRVGGGSGSALGRRAPDPAVPATVERR